MVSQPIGAQSDKSPTPKVHFKEVIVKDDVEDVIVVPDVLNLIYDKTYDVGDIIYIEVASDTYKNFTWKVVGPVTEKYTFKTVDSGKGIVIRSAEGQYHVFCAGSKSNGEITSEAIDFTVGTPKPPKPPTPIVVPEGFLGFTKVTYTSWPDGHKALATKLAQSYRLAVTKIKATDTPDEINNLLKAENRAITTELERSVLTQYNKAVSSWMVEQAKANKLVTPAQHVEVYKAIADGLDYIK